MFFLTKNEIHQLNNFPEPKEYVIEVGYKQFKYNRSQLPFISNSILQHFDETHQNFIIEYSNSLLFTLEELISSYSSFDSLFRNKTELLIEHKNISIFSFIAQSLRNFPLLQICNKVTSNTAETFSFTSEYLGDISIKQLSFINNFNLIINDKSFNINISYLSCISDKFHSLDKIENQLVCSIPEQHMLCFESFLSIFRGSLFHVDEFNLASLLYLIEYFDLKSLLQFISNSTPLPSNIENSIEFLSNSKCQLLEKHFQQSIDILIENIKEIRIEQYLQIPNENLLFLFTSSKLSIENEDFLFNLIIQLIEQDYSKKYFIIFNLFSFSFIIFIKEFLSKFSN
jgi:hypothetical protein